MKLLRSTSLLLALFGATVIVNQSLAADEKDLFLKGDAKCAACHNEGMSPQVLAIGKTRHGTTADSRTPTCTSCHGASEKHMAEGGCSDTASCQDVMFGGKNKSTSEDRNKMCQSCHQRDGQRSHWEGSIHQLRGIACTDCHKLHSAEDKVLDKRTQPEVCYTCHKQQRAEMSKPSHHPVPEGKMACSDCHNAHGTAGPKLMTRDSVNATCYTCHMEKRGPFVHSHQPVDEDCATCHNAHGTTAESMLKTRAPFLCQSCHTPHGAFPPAVAAAGASPVPPGWWDGSTITQGRSCMNCHTEIHGSNNPSTASQTPQRFFR